jgi:Zn-dependent protease
MLILQLFQDPLFVLVLVMTLVVGLTVHEYSHAWSAFRLGDPTARAMGRMSLDPRRHLDVVGSLVFLIVGFGWARPVPIDPYRLGRRGVLWVALAGPVSNVLMAAAALIPLRLAGGSQIGLVAAALAFFGLLNLNLAVFNMLPVSPLDGWKVMMGVVPDNVAWSLQQYERYGPMVLLLLIALGTLGSVSVLGTLLGSVSGFLFQALAGMSPVQAFGG